MALQGILAEPINSPGGGNAAPAAAPAVASSARTSALKGILAEDVQTPQAAAPKPLAPAGAPVNLGIPAPGMTTDGSTPAVAKPSAPLTFGSVLQGLRAIPGLALDAITAIPKAIFDSEVNPSAQEQSVEKQSQSHPTTTVGKALDFLPNAGVALTTRFFQPMFQPVADDLTTILQSDDVTKQVADGHLPVSSMESLLPALNKSNLQVMGDVVVAGLAVYMPELVGGTLDKAASATLAGALKQGAASGSIAGGVFGLAQILQTGTTDPKEIAKILSENIVGGALLGGITHSAVPLSKEAFNKATKDIQTQHGIPQYVYIDAAKVKDVFQTGKLPSEEENALIRSLGLTGEQYRQAFKDGLSIEVPAQNITTITDKPYWAQIKDSFGFAPTNKTIRADATPQMSERIMNPARQLPSPEDIRARMDAGKSAAELTYELQGDMPKAQAESLVQQASDLPAKTAEPAPEAQPKVMTELPKGVDESILTKTPGDFQQDLAGVQVAHEERTQQLETNIKDLEARVAAAKPQSVEKKNLKIELSNAKNQFRDAQQSHSDSIVQHAGALSSFVQGHLQAEHGIPAHAAQEVAGRTIAHFTEPSLIEQHGTTPLGHIAARVAGEYKAENAVKRGDTVLAKGEEGTVVRPARMPDGKRGFEVQVGKEARIYPEAEVKKHERPNKPKPPEPKPAKKVVGRKGKGVTSEKEYPTIHEGGIVKMVKGEPVKTVEGVETFLHVGDGGWIVSESSTGRFLAESRTKEGAVAKAKIAISEVGKDKFIELLKKYELPTSTEKITKVENEEVAPHLKAIRDEYAKNPKAEEELSNMLTEMLDLSKAGFRITDERTGETQGVSSTFPKWIPEGLRSMSLFRSVFEKTRSIADLSFPEKANATKQHELFDYVLSVLDDRLGVDTTAERGAILDLYGEKAIASEARPARQEKIPSPHDSGAQGGEGAKEAEIAFASVPEDKSRSPEKVPREPKEKTEKAPVVEKKALDPNELYNAERAIEQNKPRGYVGTVFKEVATWFNPVGQAQSSAVDAIMRNKGEYERVIFRTERAMMEVKKMWDAHSQEVALDFMDKVETGKLDEIPAEFRPLAEMYRERLTNTWAAIQQFKNVPFLENYFPHLWKDPKAVREANVWAKANARRPFQGNKSFTKERIFATIQEGIKAGYKLETHNPEELVQLHEQNVQKFLMANRILDDLKARGFAKLVKSGGKNKIPDGFDRINDSIAKVYLNPNIPIIEAYDEHVYNGLSDVIKGLGLEHDRKYNVGHGALGYTQRGTDKITTKFGTPLSVIAHELGHQLDYKYDLQKVFKTDPNRTYGSESDYAQKELRKLADLRYEGHDVTDSYKQYIRSAPEKMAVMLEAYVHAPQRFEEVAPRTFEKFTEFLKSHPETAPILDIKPSLVYGVREDSIYAGGMILGGEYWVQKDVARMLNNYLSPDKILDTALGKGAMNVKNTMNAFELGFSAFHLTMETMDTMITKFSIGLSRVAQGNFKGFGDMLISPITPASYFRAGQKFYNGDPELIKIENDLFTGGASLRQKQYYKNTVFDTFVETNRAVLGQIGRGEALGALKGAAFNVMRLPMAAVEATMRPLFTYYIPRLKVGAFRDLFAAELERNSQRIQDGEMTRENIARDVWNNIENRMGELNYDNLFWNRNFKTGLMLTTRAVGWNLGTAREIGGALFQDLPNEAFNAARGKGFNFTPKMAYTLSLFFFVATLGATYQYLHTGKKPGSVKDLFYPRNGATTASGEPYRIEFPTYLKDIYQSGIPQLLTGNPFGAFDSFASMLGHKSSPEVSMILDIMKNQDFYNNEIRNPHDNSTIQAKQLTLYLLSQLTPFTYQQQQNLAAGKSTIEQQVEAFFGIIRAPKAVIQSDYNAQLEALYQDQSGLHAPETPEQQAAYSKKQVVVDQVKKGDYSGIQKLVNEGIIKPSGIRQFLQNAVLTTPQKQYKYLSPANKAKLK